MGVFKDRLVQRKKVCITFITFLFLTDRIGEQNISRALIDPVKGRGEPLDNDMFEVCISQFICSFSLFPYFIKSIDVRTAQFTL